MVTVRRLSRPIRMHIDLSQQTHVRYWAKHFRVSSDDLQKAVDKVGNSASAVRKQLASARQPRPAV